MHLHERGRVSGAIPFSRPVAILNDIDGLQPHRSYRVQTHAILHLEGDADRLKIVLTNGDKIAVARKRRSEIEDWAKEKTLLIRALD